VPQPAALTIVNPQIADSSEQHVRERTLIPCR
jgi:hypothetical protein